MKRSSPGPLSSGLNRIGRLRLPAPHHGPAERLEVFGDVALPSVSVASLKPSPLCGHQLTPLSKPTVNDHVDGLLLEHMLEVRVLSRLHVRDDDEQGVNEVPLRNYGRPVDSYGQTFRHETRPYQLTGRDPLRKSGNYRKLR